MLGLSVSKHLSGAPALSLPQGPYSYNSLLLSSVCFLQVIFLDQDVGQSHFNIDQVNSHPKSCC